MLRRCQRCTLLAIFLIAGFLAPQLTHAQSASSSDERAKAEVRKTSEAIDLAMGRKDTAEMARHISDELEYTNQFGMLFTKAQWLDNVKTGKLTIPYLKHDIESIEIYGDAAVVLEISHAKFVLDGKMSNTPRRFTRMFVKQNGQWQLVGQHFSAIEKP